MSADNARAEALADFIATERDKYPRRADDMDSEELAQKIIEWLASRKPEATSDTGTHDRDCMGICRSCDRGITAVEVLDGEKRCVSSQPVQVEVTDDMIARAEREYQWSGNIRKVLVAALGGGE